LPLIFILVFKCMLTSCNRQWTKKASVFLQTSGPSERMGTIHATSSSSTKGLRRKAIRERKSEGEEKKAKRHVTSTSIVSYSTKLHCLLACFFACLTCPVPGNGWLLSLCVTSYVYCRHERLLRRPYSVS